MHAKITGNTDKDTWKESLVKIIGHKMALKQTILTGIATIATTVKSSPIAQTHQIFWDSSNDL